MKNNNKIITVIHVKKYKKAQFEKTLKSLLHQTSNIDILVLDKSNSKELAKKVTQLHNGKNKIIYKVVTDISIPASMLEVLNSHYQVGGMGVLFLSSGESVCRDYCRKLLDAMRTNNADIVVADWVWEKPKGESCYIPYEEFRNTDFELNGHEILAKYISGHGYNFTWDLLCNKLFSINLLQKAQNDLQQLLEIATEHALGLSFILYAHANKLINCHNIPCYIPFSKEKNRKQVANEVILKQYVQLFNFLENKMITLQLGQKVEKDFTIYKDKILSQLQVNIKAEVFQKLFGAEQYQTKCVEMSTFTVDFGKEYEKYEKILEAITAKETKVVSFDIFDTLISRTCLDPKDIFVALGDFFRDELSNAFIVDFKSLREMAESAVRTKYYAPHYEVYIYDIYKYMVEEYSFDKTLADRICQKEIELELEYSIVRETGKDLYKIALENNKKVIYTSDMYLPKEIIYKLLEKSGYSRENALFLSCEHKASKHQKQLYKIILKECNITANSIVHIGDNYWSDYRQAKNSHIQAFHFPNSTEMFFERIIQPLQHTNKTDIDVNFLTEFISTKYMCAIVARKFFDFPFTYHVIDFQCSPQYIGYYALGMHLYALVDWIRISTINKYDTIHFIARDGYLPLKVYEIFAWYFQNLPKANYLYLSRKALYPLSIEEKKDFFSSIIQIQWSIHSIQKCLSYFPEECLNQIEIEKIPQEERERIFSTLDEFYKSIPILDKCIHYDTLKEYHNDVKKFLNIIKPNDILFDIGYSGRDEAILKKLLGYSVDSLYLHAGCYAKFNFNKAQSNNYTFYDFFPKATFAIREITLSSIEESLKRYNTKEQKLDFVKNTINEEMDSILRTLHSNTLQFIQDFLKYHYKHKDLLDNVKKQASLPWDNYLINLPQNNIDKMLYNQFYHEDDIGHGKRYHLENEFYWKVNIPKKPKLLIRVANKLLPKGSKRRQFVKKVAIKLCPKDSKRYQFAKKLFGK